MERLLPLWPSLDGEFIISQSNFLAYKKIMDPESWPDNKIILCGSWGKSHLVRNPLKLGYQISHPEEPLKKSRLIWEDLPSQIESESIFHRWNQITEAGYSLCIVMRSPPQMCQISPPDLQSRLNSTLLVRISPPDYELRKKIFAQWLENGGVEIGEKSLQYFFDRYDSDLPRLAEYAKRLHTFALFYQKGLSICAIKSALPGLNKP